MKIIGKIKNCNSKIFFVDINNFIYSTIDYLHLIDIRDFSTTLFECKYHHYKIECLKIGYTNYFILCNLSQDNYIKHPIIYEYINNTSDSSITLNASSNPITYTIVYDAATTNTPDKTYNVATSTNVTIGKWKNQTDYKCTVSGTLFFEKRNSWTVSESGSLRL